MEPMEMFNIIAGFCGLVFCMHKYLNTEDIKWLLLAILFTQ